MRLSGGARVTGGIAQNCRVVKHKIRKARLRCGGGVAVELRGLGAGEIKKPRGKAGRCFQAVD